MRAVAFCFHRSLFSLPVNLYFGQYIFNFLLMVHSNANPTTPQEFKNFDSSPDNKRGETNDVVNFESVELN